MFEGWVSLLLNLLKLWPWRSLRARSFASVLSPSLSTTAELLRFYIFLFPCQTGFLICVGWRWGQSGCQQTGCHSPRQAPAGQTGKSRKSVSLLKMQLFGCNYLWQLGMCASVFLYVTTGIAPDRCQVWMPWCGNPSSPGCNCIFGLSWNTWLNCLTCKMPLGFWREHFAFRGSFCLWALAPSTPRENRGRNLLLSSGSALCSGAACGQAPSPRTAPPALLPHALKCSLRCSQRICD